MRKKKLILRVVLVLVCAVVFAVGLSVLFKVPYVITLLGLSGWAAFGHLITLDDDMPGEWSNPEGSRKRWRLSLLALAVKFTIFVGLFASIALFPELKEFGA